MFISIFLFLPWNGEELFNLSFFEKRAFLELETLLDLNLFFNEPLIGDFVLILDPSRIEEMPTGPQES